MAAVCVSWASLRSSGQGRDDVRDAESGPSGRVPAGWEKEPQLPHHHVGFVGGGRRYRPREFGQRRFTEGGREHTALCAVGASIRHGGQIQKQLSACVSAREGSAGRRGSDQDTAAASDPEKREDAAAPLIRSPATAAKSGLPAGASLPVPARPAASPGSLPAPRPSARPTQLHHAGPGRGPASAPSPLSPSSSPSPPSSPSPSSPSPSPPSSPSSSPPSPSPSSPSPTSSSSPSSPPSSPSSSPSSPPSSPPSLSSSPSSSPSSPSPSSSPSSSSPPSSSPSSPSSPPSSSPSSSPAPSRARGHAARWLTSREHPDHSGNAGARYQPICVSSKIAEGNRLMAEICPRRGEWRQGAKGTDQAPKEALLGGAQKAEAMTVQSREGFQEEEEELVVRASQRRGDGGSRPCVP
ncbi:PREDICTED: putative protein TPRXL [Propithecus coquereli]|uniref:putative protein TPRXL n=1 Tax=Propithecus coquereli TaxID=379532 RepID=UPI00063FACF0|nr:PREDICTED: putative protein TPRXL [Propithecus coquereli]